MGVITFLFCLVCLTFFYCVAVTIINRFQAFTYVFISTRSPTEHQRSFTVGIKQHMFISVYFFQMHFLFLFSLLMN